MCTPKSVAAIRARIEKEDAYKLHRHVRKRFSRNRYTVTKVMDVWECDVLYLQAYVKYKDNHRYIISVIDIFSKFLYQILVKTKRETSFASAFRSILGDDMKNSRRPVWVRNDKGKIFLNKYFQEILRD